MKIGIVGIVLLNRGKLFKSEASSSNFIKIFLLKMIVDQFWSVCEP